jgi:uncharacterized protein (TIGR00251 family)
MCSINKTELNITRLDNGIKISVRVIPGSSKCEISGLIDNSLKIKLDVPPVEGKANEKCIKFLSKLLGVPKTSIEIVSGEKSKNKILFIKGDPDKLYLKISDKGDFLKEKYFFPKFRKFQKRQNSKTIRTIPNINNGSAYKRNYNVGFVESN